MSTELYILCFIILHLFICLIFFVLIKTDVLKISMQLYPLIIFEPVWGIIMVLKANKYLKKNMTGMKDIQLDRLIMGDNEYKSSFMFDDDSEQSVVPLEEAILINDVETRRKLMIDVLKQDPKQYIHLLQKARENQDIEITHYASTAIMEIQREFELSISKTEAEYKSTTNDITVIDKYIRAIGNYIHSGLMQDSLLYMMRQKYDAVLSKRIEMQELNPEFYLEAIDNLLEMEVYQKAEKYIDEAINRYPKNEDIWLMKLKYYHITENGSMIKKVISDIKKSHIYLTPEAQQKLAFWC